MRSMLGISLTELIFVTGVMAIMLSASLPDFSSIKARRLTDNMISHLLATIALTRSSAVTHNTVVTLCRSNDGEHCQGKWTDGAIIFTDANADHMLNNNDRLLHRIREIKLPGVLSFNSFRNRQYLQMTPRGATNHQNGNFTWCPDSGDMRFARQIIISLSGRSRLARDMDGDGIVENSRGKPLLCD